MICGLPANSRGIRWEIGAPASRKLAAKKMLKIVLVVQSAPRVWMAAAINAEGGVGIWGIAIRMARDCPAPESATKSPAIKGFSVMREKSVTRHAPRPAPLRRDTPFPRCISHPALEDLRTREPCIAACCPYRIRSEETAVSCNLFLTRKMSVARSKSESQSN